MFTWYVLFCFICSCNIIKDLLLRYAVLSMFWSAIACSKKYNEADLLDGETGTGKTTIQANCGEVLSNITPYFYFFSLSYKPVLLITDHINLDINFDLIMGQCVIISDFWD